MKQSVLRLETLEERQLLSVSPASALGQQNDEIVIEATTTSLVTETSTETVLPILATTGATPTADTTAIEDLEIINGKETVDGSLTTGGEKWYKFRLLVNGDEESGIELTFSNYHLIDIDLELYDESGERLLRSASSSSSTVETISLKGRAAGTYYLKVFEYKGSAVGEYSLTITTPKLNLLEDYNVNDYISLRNFLEQTDGSGVKNGEKLNSNYDVDDLDTWSGVAWTETSDKRVLEIDFSVASSLVGTLDVSGCTKLTSLNCSDNRLTTLDVSNCTALTTLNCSSNALTKQDVSNCTALKELNCSDNRLTTLDVANNTTLTSLNCSNNQLTALDVAKNTALETLLCYSNQLTTLNVASNAELTTLSCYCNTLKDVFVSSNDDNNIAIDLYAGSYATWRFRTSSGETTTTSTYTLTEELPVYAESNGQTIAFALAPLDPPTLSATSETGTDIICVKIGKVKYANSYTLEYATDSNFSNATTQSFYYADTHRITGLTAGQTYYFRVKAESDEGYSESEYSNTVSIRTLDNQENLNIDYEAIRTEYADLNLPKLESDMNIIEISNDELSLANLKAAIETAKTTQKDDLIVVRTTATNNTINYTSEMDEILIDVASTAYGSITIVSMNTTQSGDGWFTNDLTINAGKLCNVVTVGGNSETVKSEVAFGGLIITGGEEAGIYNQNDSVLTIVNSTIIGNKGGIRNENSALTVANSMILENSGAGIYNQNDSDLTIVNSTIIGNNGNGINNENSVTTVRDSEISGNNDIGISSVGGESIVINSKITENHKGGISNNDGTSTVINSVVLMNSGDGISNQNNGELTVRNSTIAGNEDGISLGESAIANIYNSIVAVNNETDVVTEGGAVNAYNTLSAYTDWSNKDDEVNPEYDSTKPLFVDDANGNYRLATESQAIDMGDNNQVVNQYDLDGNERIQGGAVDLGAYEYESWYDLSLSATSGEESTFTVSADVKFEQGWNNVGFQLYIYYDSSEVEFSGNDVDYGTTTLSGGLLKNYVTSADQSYVLYSWSSATLEANVLAEILSELKFTLDDGVNFATIEAKIEINGMELVTASIKVKRPQNATLDVNGDSEFDITDVNLLHRYTAGFDNTNIADDAETSTEIYNYINTNATDLFDINGDGSFTILDVNLLHRYVAKFDKTSIANGLETFLANGERKTSEEIYSYIESNLPGTTITDDELQGASVSPAGLLMTTASPLGATASDELPKQQVLKTGVF